MSERTAYTTLDRPPVESLTGVIGCSASKVGDDDPARRDELLPATERYDSWLFDKRQAAVDAHCDDWWIFSGQFGAVTPEEELPWYDKRLDDNPPAIQRILARQVVAQLPDVDCILILAGRDYWEPLDAVLPTDVAVWDPLRGVGLFEQRSKLKELANRATDESSTTATGHDT